MNLTARFLAYTHAASAYHDAEFAYRRGTLDFATLTAALSARTLAESALYNACLTADLERREVAHA